MARRVNDRNLDSRDARRKLKASGKPYWRAIGRGLHVGYRKGKTGGVWVIRRYLGKQAYQLETIAEADDFQDANGREVLDFWQAQEVARRVRQSPKRGAYTVRDAVEAYIDRLEGRASWHDTQKRLEAFVLPVFGDRPVDDLEADEIRNWHRGIAKTMARTRTKAGAEMQHAAWTEANARWSQFQDDDFERRLAKSHPELKGPAREQVTRLRQGPNHRPVIRLWDEGAGGARESQVTGPPQRLKETKR